MKRLMSVLFIAVLFASCSSDDDNYIPEKSLVGAWTLVELNAENPKDFNNDGTADANIINEIPCIKGNASFTADGNYLITLSKVEGEVINEIEVFNCNGDIVNSGTYVLNGDQLTTTTNEPEPETSVTTIDLNGNTISVSIPAGDLGTVEFVMKKN